MANTYPFAHGLIAKGTCKISALGRKPTKTQTKLSRNVLLVNPALTGRNKIRIRQGGPNHLETESPNLTPENRFLVYPFGHEFKL